METQELIDFATYHGLDIAVAGYILAGKYPRCSCGNFKKIVTSKQSKVGMYLYRCCGNTVCEPNYGKLRPDHSKTMKEKVLSGSDAFKQTLIKKGEKRNKSLNTLEFKKTILQNSNEDFLDTDDGIVAAFSAYLSKRNKNKSHRVNQILHRFEQWEDTYKQLILRITRNTIPTKDWLESLSDDQFKDMWSRIHGINTIRNLKKMSSSRNTFFKQSLMSNFKHNMYDQTNVFVRSGLEKAYIEFFEAESIPWAYESVIIDRLDGKGFYLPDFIINLSGKLVIVETKGSFYRQPIEEYVRTKVTSAISFVKKNDWGYVLTMVTKPNKNLNFIYNALIKENV